jgi:hypothetical protein
VWVALVDSDLFFVVKVTETLKHAGYRTRVARNEGEFARALAGERPRIALVNTAARGVDYARIIAVARAAGVPIIAYGSHVDLATQERARAAGATRVIANSKLASDLLGIVARTLASAAE